MVDVEFVGQLVNSMEDSVLRLEKAVEGKNIIEANKLRTFIFDLHRQIDGVFQEVRSQRSEVRREDV